MRWPWYWNKIKHNWWNLRFSLFLVLNIFTLLAKVAANTHILLHFQATINLNGSESERGKLVAVKKGKVTASTFKATFIMAFDENKARDTVVNGLI